MGGLSIMTKQEIESLKPGDKIFSPLSYQKWLVIFWEKDEKKNLDLLIVQNVLMDYKWFLTKEQLKRFIKIKE